MSDLDAQLKQQMAYYRARAPEYDEWFYRRGRYDRGPVLNQIWFDEAASVMQTLRQIPRVPQVLEIACGTGIWTEQLLHIGEHIIAVDSSAEMLALNRRRINDDERVSHEQQNIFEWNPPYQVDLIFFGFWLSHVPPQKLPEFLQKVADALKSGGTIFMVDSRRVESSTARNQVFPVENTAIRQERTLKDGSHYEIFKIYYQAETLQQALREAGLPVQVTLTPTYFIYAQGQKPSP